MAGLQGDAGRRSAGAPAGASRLPPDPGIRSPGIPTNSLGKGTATMGMTAWRAVATVHRLPLATRSEWSSTRVPSAVGHKPTDRKDQRHDHDDTHGVPVRHYPRA